jgi:hypothetical protein
MNSVEHELTRLELTAFHLEELLSTKTTKLPPAAMEDLQISLQEIAARLVGQALKLLKKSINKHNAEALSHCP